MNKIELNDFYNALKTLDKKLEYCKDQKKSMNIKAIGGFALLFHNIRKNGYTADIDTVTIDYNENIINLIEETAKEYDFPLDWINNYNVLENDIKTIEEMIDPIWEREDIGLKNINLWIGDIETLMNSKIIAVEDTEISGRVQDLPDLIDILKHLKIDSVKKLNSKYPGILIKHPSIFKTLEKIF